jgi:DNA topoisomerase-3
MCGTSTTPQNASSTSLPVVLILTNVSLVAERLARCLAGEKYTKRSSARKQLTVIEFQGDYQDQLVTFRMLSGFTQLQHITFTSTFQGWSEGDTFEPFSTGVEWQESQQNSNKLLDLLHEASDAQHFVFWFDVTSEGEVLCFQVIDAISALLQDNFSSKVHRACFSCFSDFEISAGLQLTQRPLQAEAVAMTIRQEVDFRTKTAINHFINSRLKPNNAVLQRVNKCIHLGPDLAPLLYLCVQQFREKQIIESQNSRRLSVNVTVISPSMQQFRLIWSPSEEHRKPIILNTEQNEQLFAAKYDDLQQSVMGAFAIIRQVEGKVIEQPRPDPMNMFELIKLASTRLNMSPHDTITIAMYLYYQGYISFPRTETKSYPPYYNFNWILDELSSNDIFGDLARHVIRYRNSDDPEHELNSFINEFEVHPAIMPIRAAGQGQLAANQWNLYCLICRHFLLSFLPPLNYQQMRIDFMVENENFYWIGSEIDSLQFTGKIPEILLEKSGYPKELPKVGDMWVIEDTKVEKRCDILIECYSESELIDTLQSFGLTYWTIDIPSAIQTMIDSNFVTLTADRRLKPTDVGLELVKFFECNAPGLIRPQIRRELERTIQATRRDHTKYRELLAAIISQYKKLYDQLETNWPIYNKVPSNQPKPIRLTEDEVRALQRNRSLGHRHNTDKMLEQTDKLMEHYSNVIDPRLRLKPMRTVEPNNLFKRTLIDTYKNC